MNSISVVLLIILAGLIMGWRFSRRFVARGWSLKTRLSLKDSRSILCIVIGIAGWIGSFFILRGHPGFLWIFPEWVGLFYTDIFTAGFLITITFLCVAVSGVALCTDRRKDWVTAMLSAVLLGGYLTYTWTLNRPIARELEDSRLDGVVLQTSGSSCAPAATANVLNTFGMQTSEREMAEYLLTTTSGTVPARILIEVRELGFNAERFYCDESNWESAPVPSVIFVDHPAVGSESHAVSLMSIDSGSYEVWDPLVGCTVLNHSELVRIWHGRGIRIWKEHREVSNGL